MCARGEGGSAGIVTSVLRRDGTEHQSGAAESHTRVADCSDLIVPSPPCDLRRRTSNG